MYYSPAHRSPLSITARIPHYEDEEAIALALRDASINCLPYFRQDDLLDTFTPLLSGHTPCHGIDNTTTAFTWTAWKSNQTPPFNEEVYLWTSYRHRTLATRLASPINYYFTLSTFYGNDVPYSRTRHPSLLLPA